MLSREDFYMIKQMRQQGAYIVDIATQIGCSERTVRRYLKYPEPPARKTRHKMVKLKPFMDYIDMRLAENVWNSEVIFAEIKAMGYTGGRSMLRYYIQPKRKMRPSKRTVRFETQPGYQLQHDWGEVEVEVAGQRCKVNFAQWVTAARKGLGTPGSRTVAELESEILQLRKALNEARLERDILKKATAYFAQESLKNTR
ncbi:integrase for IS21, orfA [Shigella sonnei]|nr:integrase for IS21, orfA [Shigella sonnei]